MTRLKSILEQGTEIKPAKARLIARLKADGTLCKSGTDYKIRYQVNDRNQLVSFAKDIESIYGLNVKWGEHNSGITGLPVPFVQVRSKLAFEDLQKYGNFRSSNWAVPKEIFSSTHEVKKEFLRAFYDDEGSVIEKVHEIRLYSINKSGLEQIDKILNEFGIRTKLVAGYGKARNVFSLTIKDMASVKFFSEHIGFGLKRKQVKLNNILSTKVKDEHV